jgi:kinesin family protein 4/21/27
MRLQDVLKEREQEIAQLEISLKERETVVPAQPGMQEETDPPAVDNTDSPSVTMSPRKINQPDEIKTILHQGPGPDSADVMSSPETDESLDRLNELMRFVIAL